MGVCGSESVESMRGIYGAYTGEQSGNDFHHILGVFRAAAIFGLQFRHFLYGVLYAFAGAVELPSQGFSDEAVVWKN